CRTAALLPLLLTQLRVDLGERLGGHVRGDVEPVLELLAAEVLRPPRMADPVIMGLASEAQWPTRAELEALEIGRLGVVRVAGQGAPCLELLGDVEAREVIAVGRVSTPFEIRRGQIRSEEHTSELQ